jgi:alkylresorcinol/alkylpyrone synthase
MRIASVGTALPRHVYSQQALLAAAQLACAGRLERPGLLDLFFHRVGVETRHLALPLEAYPQLDTFRKSNSAWIECAEQLGKLAICNALNRAGLSRTDIGILFFVSITGIANPSIDARLINSMGLPLNIKRVPIFGLGCVGGAAGIARATDYVRAFPGQAAVLLSVELCSLTVQRGDLSPANLIAAGLFGDGAAAVVVTGDELDADGPRVLATRSSFYPDTEDVMGWEISEKGFELVLSKQVPEMVRRHLAGDVDAFLASNGLERRHIDSWIFHTGGPAVLQATADVLGLPSHALDASWDCLRRLGNLSSASVLFVLEDVMRNRRPRPGSYSLLAAMGPGFCSELVLLAW